MTHAERSRSHANKNRPNLDSFCTLASNNLPKYQNRSLVFTIFTGPMMLLVYPPPPPPKKKKKNCRTFSSISLGTTLTAKPKTSRQKQKHHGKAKIPHGKTKNLTAKTKTTRQKQNTSRQNQKHHGKTKIPHGKTKNLTAKTKTSRQKQILHGKSKIALVLPWVFAFAVRYLVFVVKYLVLP